MRSTKGICSGAVTCILALVVLLSSGSAPAAEGGKLSQLPAVSAADPETEAIGAAAETKSERAPERVEPTAVSESEESITAPARSWREWYALGGWIMHLLVGCSAIVVAVTLERLWRLRSSAVFPRRLAEAMGAAWARGQLDEIERLGRESASSLSRIVGAAMEARHERGSLHERVHAAGEAEAVDLGRNLPLLSAFANIATMLGLLGTVLGMIQAFDLIAVAGTGDARIVARGIFQALVTTAAGLSVGITALAIHACLRRRVESLLGDLGDLAEVLCRDGQSTDERSASPQRDPSSETVLAAAS